MIFAPEALIPKIERLSPANNLAADLLSHRVEQPCSSRCLPFTAILYVGVHALQSVLREPSSHLVSGFARLLQIVLSMAVDVGWKSVLILLVWSCIDYFLTWRKTESDLRMRREELR